MAKLNDFGMASCFDDKILDAIGDAGVRDEQERALGDQAKLRRIFQRIKRRLLCRDDRIDDERGGADEERVTIGGCLRHRFGANIARRPRPVFDVNLAVEDVGKVFGHDPGHEVHRAASGKGDDDSHDFFGVGGAGGILCSRYWRGEKKNRQKCRKHQSHHQTSGQNHFSPGRRCDRHLLTVSRSSAVKPSFTVFFYRSLRIIARLKGAAGFLRSSYGIRPTCKSAAKSLAASSPRGACARDRRLGQGRAALHRGAPNSSREFRRPARSRPGSLSARTDRHRCRVVSNRAEI